jgi:hypothetical protein
MEPQGSWSDMRLEKTELRNEELHNVYSSSDIKKTDQGRCSGQCSVEFFCEDLTVLHLKR